MTTAEFDAGSVPIAYDDVGEGEPIVLVHGFASERTSNWKERGWYDALVEAGRRVVALDCRGHGESGTPHDHEEYEHGAVPGDVVTLLDHLSIPETDLMGYSMGGDVATRLLLEHPERFNAVVLAAIDATLLAHPPHGPGMAEAFEADDPDAIADELARDFRVLAESWGNDLEALAAYLRAPRPAIDLDRLARVPNPVLVVAGGDDELVGDPFELADAVPGAEAAVVPGCDHLTTVGDDRYKEAVLEFLDREGL